MRYSLALTVFLLILSTGAGAGEPMAAIDLAIGVEMTSHRIPGLQLAIVFGATPLYCQNYGLANVAGQKPVAVDTVFRLGSISKLFTAIAIMQLRDAGRLGLDDPVRRFLPWFHLADDPAPRVTVRELLLQLGGLPREAPGSSWTDRVMPDRETLIRNLAETETALAPEVSWKYSNLGYALLGLAVEAASGQSYADYVRRYIALPLGMTRLSADPQPDLAALATGYDVVKGDHREPRDFLAMKALTSAGGIVDSACDLAKLASWMLDDRNSPVLSASSRREMLRVQAIFPDWSGGQGIGFELWRKDGVLRIGHAGRAAGYSGYIEVDPASNLGVVVLTDADDSPARAISEQALSLLAAALPPKPQSVPDLNWQKYVGNYRSATGRSAITIVDGRLAWIDPGALDPVKTRVLLDPAGPDRFRFESGALIGEILSFETDVAGRVLRMRAAGTTDQKEQD